VTEPARGAVAKPVANVVAKRSVLICLAPPPLVSARECSVARPCPTISREAEPYETEQHQRPGRWFRNASHVELERIAARRDDGEAKDLIGVGDIEPLVVVAGVWRGEGGLGVGSQSQHRGRKRGADLEQIAPVIVTKPRSIVWIVRLSSYTPGLIEEPIHPQ
jgi:hypothetical protein